MSVTAEQLRKCRNCGIEKDAGLFYSVVRRGKPGFHGKCKDCTRRLYKQKRLANNAVFKEYDSAYRRRNRDSVRAYTIKANLKRNYGMTVREYQDMLFRQDGKCAICNRPERGSRRLSVDHDHENKMVRGLLCIECNFGLGKFHTEKELDDAARYLRENKKRKDLSRIKLVPPINLNLGSWNTRIDGYTNVDLGEDRDTDIVADAFDLSFIQSGTVDAIRASNILEHAPHVQTLDILKEWHRVLVPGGKLWLSVPDFEVVIKNYAKHGLNDYLINLLYGEQNGKYAYHYISFTWPNLRELLDKAGFQSAERILELPYGVKDASRLVDTITGESVAINVEVIK